MTHFHPEAPHVVVFPYGAVVFFNTPKQQQLEILQLARLCAALPNPVQTPTSSSGDSYRIVLQPDSQHAEW